MARLRIGYVGCGFMAQKVHIPNIVSLAEECELAAIAELRPRLGRAVQKRYGIPTCYSNHTELARDETIAAVAVSGNGTMQGEIAIELLASGKDVFMEKPMAVSVAQAERILDAERRSGRRLMIAYMKRYDAGNLLVRALLDGFRGSGELGKVRYVRNHGFCGNWTGGLDTPMDTTDEPYPAATGSPWPSWLPEQQRKGYYGYLQQYTHNVNLVRWFLDAGDKVVVKSTHLETQNGVAGLVVLEIAGVLTVIESGGVRYHGWDEHTQIYFEKGWIRTDAPPLLLRNVPARVEVYRGDRAPSERSAMFPGNEYTWSYKEEMRHFIECVKTGAPFRSTAADAMSDVRALESIYWAHVGLSAT